MSVVAVLTSKFEPSARTGSVLGISEKSRAKPLIA